MQVKARPACMQQDQERARQRAVRRAVRAVREEQSCALCGMNMVSKHLLQLECPHGEWYHPYRVLEKAEATPGGAGGPPRMRCCGRVEGAPGCRRQNHRMSHATSLDDTDEH
jgi:hypothetical protein